MGGRTGSSGRSLAVPAGVVAVLVGAVLVAMGDGGSGTRPEVLGRVVTGDAPATTTAPTVVPITAATTATPAPVAPTTSVARTVTTTTAAAPARTPAPRPQGTTTVPRAPCPSGAPVAEVRSWEGASDASGAWHVVVTGIVANRTGDAVDVGPLRLWLVAEDGTRYEVAEDMRPVPDPARIPDDGEATWRFEGTAPVDRPFAGAEVALTTWACASPG